MRKFTSPGGHGARHRPLRRAGERRLESGVGHGHPPGQRSRPVLHALDAGCGVPGSPSSEYLFDDRVVAVNLSWAGQTITIPKTTYDESTHPFPRLPSPPDVLEEIHGKGDGSRWNSGRMMEWHTLDRSEAQPVPPDLLSLAVPETARREKEKTTGVRIGVKTVTGSPGAKQAVLLTRFGVAGVAAAGQLSSSLASCAVLSRRDAATTLPGIRPVAGALPFVVPC